MSRRFAVWFSLAFALVLTLNLLSCSVVEGVSPTRLAYLTHGINAAHWFAQAPLTQENFETRITTTDIQRIQELGFRHVRLPLDPAVLLDVEHPETLNADNLRYVDAAIDLILSHQLAVIVDLHPRANFKRQLYGDARFVEVVASFWRSLADHISTRNPERVFLEVMNEPATEDPQVWYVIQTRLLKAMREGAPDHTLIASANLRVGDRWDDIAGLEVMTPVEDPNVVYNFHFYKPMSFTHQGSDWGEETWKYLQNIPYPSNPGAIAAILPTIQNDTARDWLEDYGEQHWNRDKLDSMLRRAENWARSHHVSITCNEFGVYRHAAPPTSRATWIRDVRSILESHHIGWAMWEYNAGFGLVQVADERSTVDEAIVQALFNNQSGAS